MFKKFIPAFGLVLVLGCGNDSGGLSADPDPTPKPAEPEPAWQELRGYVHVHSAYSHDACDGDGIVDGVLNAQCILDLRKAICESGARFVQLTDHPSFMEDYAFDDVLLFDPTAGDLLVVEAGIPVGNRMSCGYNHRVTVMAGYESHHTMPLGMRGHFASPDMYKGVSDETPHVEMASLVDGIKGSGAVAALAHSEEGDLSAERIAAAGFDAMEWYNPHGNFKNIFGGDILSGDIEAVADMLGSLDSFLLGSDSGAHADLLYLPLLRVWPQEGFEKWRAVNRTSTVTGLLGSDVHQNVSIDPICQGDPVLVTLCQIAAAAWPNALTQLLAGGQIVLTDGKRIDGYPRIFRWLDNRVLALEDSPVSINAAIRQGRNYGVFRVFGEPEGFSYTADFGDGVQRAIGANRPSPAHLRVMMPRPEMLLDGGAPFDAAMAMTASLHLKVFRTDANQTVLHHEGVYPAGSMVESWAIVPGAYHVEIGITPYHLTAALGEESAFAQDEYLWVITNPIRIY